MRTRCVTPRTLNYTIVARSKTFEVIGRNKAVEASPRIKSLLVKARERVYTILASVEQSSTS